MADGELGAVFKGLAADADQAGGNIAESIAKVGEQTADKEETALTETLDTEAKNAENLSSISPKEPAGDVPAGTAPAAADSSKVSNVLNPGEEAPKIQLDESGNPRLLNADQATMDPNKFTGYALNPDHPVGGNKARVFASATGFTKDNAQELMDQIQKGVTENVPVAGKVDQWGERFTVEIPVTGPTGAGTVTTGWIYKPGETTPSLTTLLMKGKKK
ncbi:MAG TPA: hypothetical protein VH352_12680 [Pseudonocardiaceae bacterium]|jgi:hypothetical protein|nr:hypothetical protein [Pseudonocardiaceae bacterium]